MDYGDIVVHLFDPEERKNYGIEDFRKGAARTLKSLEANRI